LAVMKVDVEGSRQEPGCIRFDLIKGGTARNRTHGDHAYAVPKSQHETTPCAQRTQAKARARGTFTRCTRIPRP
jgi:quinol monooxygenase YgiN